MSAHTPGPWTVAEHNEVIAPCTEHPHCHKTVVFGARCLGGDTEYLQCSTGPRTTDNARLIAAAPDLLKAAQLTALHFERNRASGNFQGDDEHEEWTALSYAIAKAEAR